MTPEGHTTPDTKHRTAVADGANGSVSGKKTGHMTPDTGHPTADTEGENGSVSGKKTGHMTPDTGHQAQNLSQCPVQPQSHRTPDIP